MARIRISSTELVETSWKDDFSKSSADGPMATVLAYANPDEIFGDNSTVERFGRRTLTFDAQGLATYQRHASIDDARAYALRHVHTVVTVCHTCTVGIENGDWSAHSEFGDYSEDDYNRWLTSADYLGELVATDVKLDYWPAINSVCWVCNDGAAGFANTCSEYVLEDN